MTLKNTLFVACTIVFIPAELQINFEQGDYVVQEGSNQNLSIVLRLRNNQNPFNIKFTPVEITNVANIPSAFIDTNVTRGSDAMSGSYQLYDVKCKCHNVCHLQTNVGSDFTNFSKIITVPAGSTTLTITHLFEVIDDDIVEIEQVFVVIAMIQNDVPNGTSCFQLTSDGTRCFGRIGATLIRINDNDGKFVSEIFSTSVIFISCVQKWSLDFLRESLLCLKILQKSLTHSPFLPALYQKRHLRNYSK